jgi:hypothetical protein
MLDGDADDAYIQLEAEWKASPDGSSVMLLPSFADVPVRIDLFFDSEDRLEAVRVAQASRYLVADALAEAVPFEPLPG